MNKQLREILDETPELEPDYDVEQSEEIDGDAELPEIEEIKPPSRGSRNSRHTEVILSFSLRARSSSRMGRVCGVAFSARQKGRTST